MNQLPPISIIVAIASNNAIGKDNQLLWHLPEDLKRFKKLTLGHKLVMGKNTFYSLPVRPLPGRTSIVLSDQVSDRIEGCIMAYSIEEVTALLDYDKENFIIGGGSVYRQFLPLASRLYITWVHHDFNADTFFDVISPEKWTLVEKEDYPADERHPFPYSFHIYEPTI